MHCFHPQIYYRFTINAEQKPKLLKLGCPKLDLWEKNASYCSGHTSATTWNLANSEGTASDECAWCESRKSKCLDQKWRN